MCIIHYLILASILLYHSHMKDISRLCRASLDKMHTKNMIRNVFVCTSRSLVLLMCCSEGKSNESELDWPKKDSISKERAKGSSTLDYGLV